ncbi:haloacid dehalogenase-like hydrolase [Paenibacillus sp. UNCCL117]|uniref:HAD family hydrolase n=1 Tax=unclassified Paenibacillus TaxID=185978 RepID=UPI000887B5F3|nr:MULTISPECIES: HAD hydrolase family protein [unclassified Paenibacillus]SDE27088.1 haloacid dehalogenase-like hydrolase [Paenibacillus sp. cl123]SFW62758.1 haloacid dehalogenase-like hydrolase [Paenibacillus sp. UNCCL117]
MGLRPEEIVTAGDELTDLDMMESGTAAHAICPGNAHAEVKERVLQLGGSIGGGVCSDGVIEAFGQLARRRGWAWD